MIFKVRVTPRAKENKIIGWEDEVLKIRVTAPPVDGRANRAMVELLSKEYKVAKSNVQIVRGLKGREKEVWIEGV